MQQELFVHAKPKKKFFVELFTRDISFEDCILDLIDNSIDGIIREKEHKFGSSLILKASHPQKPKHTIKIVIGKGEVSITDDCGGIDYDKAVNEAFNFGASDRHQTEELGVYGIGLKRALFKIGKEFKVKSSTVKSSFVVSENLDTWIKQDADIEDWRFKASVPGPGVKKAEAGTSITISPLTEEIVELLRDKSILIRLKKVIARTYMLFLNRFVVVTLNGDPVAPEIPPLGQTEQTKFGRKSLLVGKVNIEMITTLSKDPTSESAGWYIFCNGRNVEFANKFETTGWGISGLLPTYQPKFRNFVGLAFFTSKAGLELPWRTTKRGINKESSSFQRALPLMATLSQPIIKFLTSVYSDEVENTIGSEVRNQVKPLSIDMAIKKKNESFSAPKVSLSAKNVQRIQYDVEPLDVKRIREHLKSPSMALSHIGKLTFDYYLKRECGK